MNEFAIVRAVLSAERQSGQTNFDKAWKRAQRHLAPAADAPPEILAAYDDLKPVLREEKARWRAAFEGRVASEEEMRAGWRHAERRLRDLLEYDERRQLDDD